MIGILDIISNNYDFILNCYVLNIHCLLAVKRITYMEYILAWTFRIYYFTVNRHHRSYLTQP